jgi:hypothetical protein
MKEAINENTRHAAYFDPRQPKASPNGNEKELQEEDSDDYTEEVWGDEDDEGDDIEEEDDDNLDEDLEADKGNFEEEEDDEEDEF